jgi:hypothetical protein
MHVTKYPQPVKDAKYIVPHTYESIKSNTPFDPFSLLGKFVLAYFPKAHPLHLSLCLVLNYGRPITISLRMLKFPMV